MALEELKEAHTKKKKISTWMKRERSDVLIMCFISGGGEMSKNNLFCLFIYIFITLNETGSIVISPWFCRIIVDLLKMNVAPLAVFQTLKAMCAGQKISDTIAPDTSTVTEARGQCSASESALIMLVN